MSNTTVVFATSISLQGACGRIRFFLWLPVLFLGEKEFPFPSRCCDHATGGMEHHRVYDPWDHGWRGYTHTHGGIECTKIVLRSVKEVAIGAHIVGQHGSRLEDNQQSEQPWEFGGSDLASRDEVVPRGVQVESNALVILHKPLQPKEHAPGIPYIPTQDFVIFSRPSKEIPAILAKCHLGGGKVFIISQTDRPTPV